MSEFINLYLSTTPIRPKGGGEVAQTHAEHYRQLLRPPYEIVPASVLAKDLKDRNKDGIIIWPIHLSEERRIYELIRKIRLPHSARTVDVDANTEENPGRFGTRDIEVVFDGEGDIEEKFEIIAAAAMIAANTLEFDESWVGFG